MKKAKNIKPNKRKKKDDEIYEKIKSFKVDTSSENDYDDDIPMALQDETEIDEDKKEDDF